MTLSHSAVYWSHILIIAPILIYVGICKNNCSPYIYQTILTLGIFALVYHLYLYYISLMKNKK